ncbi:MAG: energy-coupling factor ABC transporter ATP-binding protein [Candidatus Omnitrophota bacterium]
MIKIKNLKFSYPDGRPVFSKLNFEYSQGCRLGFFGRNGSGKTTLLRLIMGLLRPQSGQIEIFAKLRNTEKDFAEVRRRIGYLFQNPDDQLFCPTVREEIAFGPLNLGKRAEEAAETVKETCKILGLDGFEDRITFHLSGGEKRLTALASVISMKPELLLLDEPTNDLDEDKTKTVLDYLRNNTKSFIMVSQELDHLKYAGVNEICRLENSRIVPA